MKSFNKINEAKIKMIKNLKKVSHKNFLIQIPFYNFVTFTRVLYSSKKFNNNFLFVNDAYFSHSIIEVKL